MAAELASTLAPTEDDRLLQAEALVRAFCGWHIAPSREDTATVRTSGGGVVMLPSLHVTAVDSISDDSYDLTVEDDYTWSTSGVVTRRGTWGVGALVEVAFTHGYDDPPAEVTGIVQALAQRAVQNPGSLVRTQDGPFSDTYSQTGFNQSLPIALLEAEQDILRRYRIPALG